MRGKCNEWIGMNWEMMSVNCVKKGERFHVVIGRKSAEKRVWDFYMVWPSVEMKWMDSWGELELKGKMANLLLLHSVAC
jgi:hypothetical protein